MIKRIEKMLPVGIPIKKELTGIIIGICFAIIRSLSYFGSYYNYYNHLFEHYKDKKVLVEGRIMADFYVVIDGCFEGFYVVAFLLIALVIFHYAYHYIDSKSIYTMKRLPRKIELHIRCLTVPLISILICIILPLILLLVYYKHYMTVTPPECLVEGQWEILITNLFL